MKLIREALIVGLILIGMGVGAYFGSGRASVTALIPAFFGLPIFLGGLIATKNLKLGMHIAAFFGILGFLAPLGRVIPVTLKGEFAFDLPMTMQLLMILVCGLFTVLCVLSFVKARAAKKETA